MLTNFENSTERNRPKQCCSYSSCQVCYVATIWIMLGASARWCVSPKCMPLPLGRSPAPSNTPNPRPTPITTQTASRSNQPFPQFTYHADRPTERWNRLQACTYNRLRSIDCIATRLIITRNQSNLERAASPPLTAENGLARCVCNAHCRRIQSLSRRYATSTLQYNNDARSFAQLCHKVPIGYNGIPHIYPQNCPFPFDDLHPI